MIDFSTDPFVHFERLLQEALEKKVLEANAMALATVDEKNAPSVRIVYYKGMIRGGFSFYTNYQGAKARDIEKNPQVCANIFWAELAQQVRISGRAEKLTRAENEAYFATRARLSQLGAWASQQSEIIPNYEYFQKKLAEYETKFLNQEVPCPPHWGGYRILPQEIEFWFGHLGRLHERYVYEKAAAGWRTFMRSP